MATDAKALKECLNGIDALMTLAAQRTTLHRSSQTEMAGPCPDSQCGGEDRFKVKKDRWFCRTCHSVEGDNPKGWGDIFKFYMHYDGLSFVEAMQAAADDFGLDLADFEKTGNWQPAERKPKDDIPSQFHCEVPNEKWQERATKLVEWAQRQLWQNEDALSYLTRQRGLDAQTIKDARLGYVPKSMWDPDVVRWGFEPSEVKSVWIPSGWTIPCWMRGNLQYIKVRRLQSEIDATIEWNRSHPKRRRDSGKYMNVTGSEPGGVVYSATEGPLQSDLLLIEGEYNALALKQALCGVGTIVSTGSATGSLSIEANIVIGRAPRWWARYDDDRAGKSALANLRRTTERVTELTWLFPEKDPNDALLAGHDLAAWAFSQIGPRDAERRKAWAQEWLEEFELCDLAEQDSHAMRAYRAMLAEYEKVAVQLVQAA